MPLGLGLPPLRAVAATHPDTDDPKALAGALIPVLGRTGQLLFLYALVYALGVVLT